MKSIYIVLSFCFALVQPVFGQYKDSDYPADDSSFLFPDILVKTNIFSLIEPDMVVTLAVEYRNSLKQSYQLEVGYIYFDAMDYDDNSKLSAGYRIKPEWRFYNRGRNYRHTRYTNYLAVEGIVKAVYNRHSGFVGRQCNSGNCAYSQKMDYTDTRNVIGIGGKFGRENFIGKRIFLDYYAGLGIRYRWNGTSLPSDTEGREVDSFPFFERTDMVLPYLSFGLKIGLRVE